MSAAEMSAINERLEKLESKIADIEKRLADHLDGKEEPDTPDPTRMHGVVRRKYS